MSILRSEEMHLLKLVMSKDQEYPIIDIIGQNEMAHFVNVNEEEQLYKLPYMDMLRRCEEAERHMVFILKQCGAHGIKMERAASVTELTELTQAYSEEKRVAVQKLFDVVEKDVKSTEKFITEQMDGARQMKEESNHLIEYFTVLKKAAAMIFSGEFGEARPAFDGSHAHELAED